MAEPATTTTTTPENSIREVFGDEIYTQHRALANYAFGASPQKPDPAKEAERRDEMLRYGAASRYFVAFSGEQPQATAALFKMTENVRGKIMTMSGVSGVASMPAGRRQGHVRNLFIRLFEEMRADGCAVSTLYPFRESFYERLGFAAFQAPRYFRFNPIHLAPLVRVPKAGTVEQQPMSTAWQTWRDFAEVYQGIAHGFSLRDVSADVRNRDENSWWVAIARDHEGTVVGVLQFRITGYEKRLEGIPYYNSALGKYLLLDWVGRHADQVHEASLRVGPADQPNLWFHDLKATISTADDQAWTGPMGRIVSVADLTGISAGEGDHEIALQIVDDYAPWNSGVHTFRSENGVLTVTPGGEPVMTMTIQGLAALVYAGQDPADFIYRGWGDPDEAAQQTLRALFPPAAPVLHEEF